MDWGHASAVLEAEARASFEGLRRGAVRSMMLVGDDFRFQDAGATFGAWEDLLATRGWGRYDGSERYRPSRGFASEVEEERVQVHLVHAVGVFRPLGGGPRRRGHAP